MSEVSESAILSIACLERFCAGRSAAESSPRVGFAAGRIRESGDWTRTGALLDEGVTDSTIQAASDADAWSFAHFQESRF